MKPKTEKILHHFTNYHQEYLKESVELFPYVLILGKYQ